MAPSFNENERPRSMSEALADLRASYEKRPTAALARMIQQLESEIARGRGVLGSAGQPTG